MPLQPNTKPSRQHCRPWTLQSHICIAHLCCVKLWLECSFLCPSSRLVSSATMYRANNPLPIAAETASQWAGSQARLNALYRQTPICPDKDPFEARWDRKKRARKDLNALPAFRPLAAMPGVQAPTQKIVPQPIGQRYPRTTRPGLWMPRFYP